jgi:hypothetical protein
VVGVAVAGFSAGKLPHALNSRLPRIKLAKIGRTNFTIFNFIKNLLQCKTSMRLL